MLSILYILHHCNMLQSLGGNFPHRAVVRWGCALTCLLQMRWHSTHNLCDLLRVPGCSIKQQGGSSSRAALFLLPITCSASGQGQQGIAVAAVHITDLFLVIQRKPEIPFPLLSIPSTPGKHQELGITLALGYPRLGSAPRLHLSRTVL